MKNFGPKKGLSLKASAVHLTFLECTTPGFYRTDCVVIIRCGVWSCVLVNNSTFDDSG